MLYTVLVDVCADVRAVHVTRILEDVRVTVVVVTGGGRAVLDKVNDATDVDNAVAEVDEFVTMAVTVA